MIKVAHAGCFHNDYLAQTAVVEDQKKVSTRWTLVRRTVSSRPWLLDTIWLLVLLALGGGAALVLGWSRIEQQRPVPKFVLVDGVKVDVGPKAGAQLRRLARARGQARISLFGYGINYRTTLEDLGADVEVGPLVAFVTQLANRRSTAFRHFARRGERTVKRSLPVSFNSEKAVEALVGLKEKFDQPALDARFDFKKNRVSKEQCGRSLDVYGTLEALEKAVARGAHKVKLVMREVPAQVTAKELLGIDVSAVAGFYETPYSRMNKDKDRTHNLKLGASMLDGKVILPGATFSFNEVVGDRSQARGFRYAPVIAGGKIVEGMGGGTCQVASTLYAAAFFAGLTVVERVPHSRPSSYIKLGLDATVSYPTKDLVLKNPLPYPVVIHFTVEKGIARAEIRAKERPFTVTLLRKVVDKQAYPVRIVDDANLPRGKEVVTQRGVPGYRVLRYRIIERGKVAYRFQSYDRYPPTVEFVHRGTGDGAALKRDGIKPPKADGHKPYRASESLRMVQGSGIWYEKSHN